MTFILLRHLCEAWLAIDYFACNASVWNLMMIAIDRYQGATKPLSHLVNRTSKKERELSLLFSLFLHRQRLLS